jgi:hypothetical protein
MSTNKFGQIELYGPGVDLEIYEISPEDCSLLLDNEGDVYDVMERSRDLSSSLGFTEPYASDLLITYRASQNDEPVEVDLTPDQYAEITEARDEQILTSIGKSYLARVSLIRRNHWASIRLDKEFDSSLLRIVEFNPRLGSSGDSPDLQWASVSFKDCLVDEFRSFDASSEFYIIDSAGRCMEIEI